MTENEEQAIEDLKSNIEYAKNCCREDTYVNQETIYTILNLVQKQQKEIKKWENYCTVDLEREITELNNKNFELENNNKNLKQKLDEEWGERNNLEQSSYEEERRLKAEIAKKDKIIDLQINFLYELGTDRPGTVFKKLWNEGLNAEECGHCRDDNKKCVDCIKQYFERKVNNAKN